MERTMTATEARVHFGELLDSVVKNNDVVFVERAGKPQVVVVGIDEWHKRGHQDKWERAKALIAEHDAYMAAEEAAGRVHDFDAVELIRRGRGERDEQLARVMRGR
jgi:prevent-host-death family protein